MFKNKGIQSLKIQVLVFHIPNYYFFAVVGNEIVNEMAEKIRGKGLLKIVLTTTSHSSP